MKEKRRIALIPAYEPDKNMLEVAAGLKKQGFEIVIVNDGSGDGSFEIFEQALEFAAVLSHGKNRGKGAALKTGFQYISQHFKAPFTVVTVDADGQHKAEDALRVCMAAEENRDSLILGSRSFHGKVPLRSRFGNTVTRFVYRIFSGVRVYDTQTGLRAFSDRILPRMLTIEGERYEYEMNMLMRFASEQRKIQEIRIDTVYLDGNSSSHFDTVKDSYRIYKEILKFSASSFFSFIVDYGLYCILLALSGRVIFANIAARIVSAVVNYSMNRKMVFRSRASVVRSGLQYLSLAVFILGCNTGLLQWITGLGLNRYLAKIMVEFVMSGVSWFVQHKLIFGREKESAKEEDLEAGMSCASVNGRCIV